MRGGTAADSRRLSAPALASLVLHAGALLVVAALHRADPLPSAAREQGVEIVWQDSPEDSAPGGGDTAPPASAEAEPRQPLAEDAPPPEPALAEALPPEPPPAASPSALSSDAPSADDQPEPQSAEAPPADDQPEPQSAEAPPVAEPLPPRVAEAPPQPEQPPPPEPLPPQVAEAPPQPEQPPPPELPPPPPAAPAPPRIAARQHQQQQGPAQATTMAAAARQAPPGPAAPPDTPGGSQVTGAVSPPRPLEGFRNPEPEYPFASRQRGDQGVVMVRLGISATGEVTEVEVVATSGHPALDDSARRAVQRWRFRPAMRDGVPIPGSVRTAVHFRLS